MIQTGGTEPVQVYVTDVSGRPLTSKTDIKLSVWRASDGYSLDWSDDTFKASGWTTRQQALTELDGVNLRGWYRLDNTSHPNGKLDTSQFANAAVNDTYFLTVEQVGGDDAGNVPQVGELKVGHYADNLDAKISQRATPSEVNTQVQAVIVANDLDHLLKTNPGAAPAGTNTFIKQILDGIDSISTGGSLYTIKQCWSLNPSTDVLSGQVWAEKGNLVITTVASLSVTWYDIDGQVLFTLTDAAPDAQGFFKVSKSTPGLADNTSYYCVATVTLADTSTVKAGMGLFTIG